MKKASGGARKHGRGRVKCERYRREHRREKHKISKWSRLIKKLSPENPMKKQLKKKIKEYEEKILVGGRGT